MTENSLRKWLGPFFFVVNVINTKLEGMFTCSHEIHLHTVNECNVEDATGDQEHYMLYYNNLILDFLSFFHVSHQENPVVSFQKTVL